MSNWTRANTLFAVIRNLVTFLRAVSVQLEDVCKTAKGELLSTSHPAEEEGKRAKQELDGKAKEPRRLSGCGKLECAFRREQWSRMRRREGVPRRLDN